MAETFWTYAAGSYGSCAIGTDGSIYFGASSSLYSLRPNGTLRWKCSIGTTDRCTPAIADDGTVYIGCTDGKLYAVSYAGNLKWNYATGGSITSSPAIGPDGVVYFGSRDGKLYAVSPNGTLYWAFAALDQIHTSSPAIGYDGTIYVGSYDGNLYAVNPDGTERWRYTTGKGIVTSPAISPDGATIYVGSWDGYLYAINADGSLAWKLPVPFANGSTCSSPAVGPDGTVYVGSNQGTMYAISASGTVLWRYETGSDIRSSPAVSADGTIYFGSYDGYVYALNADGSLKWRFLTRAPVYASPAIQYDGTVVVASTEGKTYGGLRGTPPPTTAPDSLTATGIAGNGVRLQWRDNSADEYGFRIERRTAFTSFAVVASVPANTTTWQETGLESGITYTYRVCAFQQGGNTGYTNEASVTMPGLARPANLVATGVSDTRIDLLWTDRSSNEAGFEVERMTGPNGHWQLIAILGGDPAAYSDQSVNPASTYYYRVRAFGVGAYSDYSNEAWAVPSGMDLSEVELGNTTRKQMALTFDAGAVPILPSLLDVLRNYGVRASFFITGRVAEQEPNMVRQIALDGHHIANHTYTHPNLTTCSDAQIVEELIKADQVIYQISGHHTRPYFRAPGLNRDDRVLAVAASVGFRNIDCTAGGGDYGNAWTVEQIINNTLVNARNGCIMLYHASATNTVEALPTIITELRARGYELVTVPELLAPKVFTSPPDTLCGGWNLVSMPGEPAMPQPSTVFHGLSIDGSLYRWDKESATIVLYDSFNPQGFGPVSPDEGYWLRLSSASTLRYACSEQTLRRHIKLPHRMAGWAIIGYPFETPQEFANCSVFNPYAPEPKTVPVAQAMELGWVTPTLYWWDSSTQSLVDLGVPDSFPSSTQIQPWHGYWIRTSAPGLELIVPKPN